MSIWEYEYNQGDETQVEEIATENQTALQNIVKHGIKKGNTLNN